MSGFVVPLASAAGAPDVGGKGASLGSLARIGVAVPSGFVVTSGAFTASLDALDPDGSLRAGIEALGAEDLATIARVAAAVRERIATAPLPAPVAYRRRLRMSETGHAMAVVVQRMVRPRAAGVMFTRSPVTGDRSVVAIEGTWGLGSALVSGDVTPDSFVISKITGEITGRRVSSKGQMHSYLPNGLGVSVTDTPPDLRDRACLTDDEIRALAALGGRVETHYGTPQDIEWAVLDDDAEAAAGGAAPAPEASPDPAAAAAERIVLLQSRPETVWAARAPAPLATPKPHAADHVLALFGKPL